MTNQETRKAEEYFRTAIEDERQQWTILYTETCQQWHADREKLEAKQIEAEQINRELIQAQRNYNEAVDALTDTQHQLTEARAIIEAMKRETTRIKDAHYEKTNILADKIAGRDNEISRLQNDLENLAKAYETRGNLLDSYIDDAKRHRQILADIHSMTEADKVF